MFSSFQVAIRRWPTISRSPAGLERARSVWEERCGGRLRYVNYELLDQPGESIGRVLRPAVQDGLSRWDLAGTPYPRGLGGGSSLKA